MVWGDRKSCFLYINEMNVVFLLLHPYIQGTCVVCMYVSTCTPPLFRPFLLFTFTIDLLHPLRLHFFWYAKCQSKLLPCCVHPTSLTVPTSCGAHGHIPTPYYQPPLLSNNLFCSCLFFWNDPGGVERCCHIDKGFHLQLPFQDSIQPHF